MAISVLLVSVFGQPNEARLIEALRSSRQAAIELVAEDGDEIVGHLCLSRLEAPEGWLALAPVCVRNALQGQGLGGDLVHDALVRARDGAARAVVVVGDPDYYSRFGFAFDGPADLRSPYPQRYTGIYPIAPETAAAQTFLVYPPAFADA